MGKNGVILQWYKIKAIISRKNKVYWVFQNHIAGFTYTMLVALGNKTVILHS